MDFDENNYTDDDLEPVRTWPTRLIGAGVVSLCVLMVLSLLTYDINEMGWSVLNQEGHEAATNAPCTNLLGVVGLYLAGLSYAVLGAASIYSYILIAIIGVDMVIFPLRARTGRWVSLIIMIISTCAFLDLQPWIWKEWAQTTQLYGVGGLLGYFDGTCVLAKLVEIRWALILTLLAHAISFIYFVRETPKSVAIAFWKDTCGICRFLKNKYQARKTPQLQDEEDWKTEAQPITATDTPTGFVDERPENGNEPRFNPQAAAHLPQPERKPLPIPPVRQTPAPQSPPLSAPQGQLPQRVRPTIQTAPPPVPAHEAPVQPRQPQRPVRQAPARDPFDPEDREEEERVPDFVPRPATQRVSQPAPVVRTQTPRPADRTLRNQGNGDNLLDLMPEVEDEIERRLENDIDDDDEPIRRRSGMPLSNAAKEAYRRFKGITDDETDADDAPSAKPKQASAKSRPVSNNEDDIDTPPAPAPLPRLNPHIRPTPTPAPKAAPSQGMTERIKPAAKPTRQELPEDSRTMYEDYPLPPYDLLNYRPPAEEDTAAAREEMYSTQQNIIETLSSFRIDVEAGDITRGPSITRYEFYPPKGLKLNRISNLADNLRMATQSKSINILAPIPGKNTVGIELENEFKSPVYLRELLQSEAFHSPKLRIPVALGKDVYGTPVIGDLAAMPHTLVAGTTGSGKSVCVNSMILSMLYKFRPDELRLILVDPKVVEMQPYKKLPHLACPVVTNAARVIGALRWAVNEMEHRYKLFSKIGVRNFEDFNNRPEDYAPEPDEEEVQEYNSLPDNFDAADAIVRDIEDSQGSEYLPEEEEQGEFDFDADEQIPAKLPYIVIIIDELADLMMQVKEDLENYIARLTQKARAAGIHLVAATQTPRANVITGIIKANIPSRLAFKVASPLDSRVILDTNGAENLLGKGDFLFLPPGGITKITRAQGAFVSDPEIASIVKFCASHAKQNFVQGVTAEMNNAEGGSADGGDGGGRLGGNGMSDEDAELYTRCVNLVITERKASTSMLQRRFSIGYGRAAKIMDMMEARGVIGPASGNTSRPREVLIEAPE